MTSIIPFTQSRLFGGRVPSAITMLDDFFNDQWPFGRALPSETFKVDVKDGESEYLLEAELPGVKKEELAISIDEGRVTISVKRNEENNDDARGYIHRERRSLSMSRSLFLADAASEGAYAKLEDGVLRVSLPKAAPVITKKEIAIQ